MNCTKAVVNFNKFPLSHVAVAAALAIIVVVAKRILAKVSGN